TVIACGNVRVNRDYPFKVFSFYSIKGNRVLSIGYGRYWYLYQLPVCLISECYRLIVKNSVVVALIFFQPYINFIVIFPFLVSRYFFSINRSSKGLSYLA